MRLLLDAGTDPRVPDAALRTPLHGAVAAAHRDVAQVLLHKGARPCRKARWLGLRPAGSVSGGLSQRQSMPQAAPSSGQPRPIRRFGPRWPAIQSLVFEIGARAGAKDAKGRTPLLLARQLDRGKGDAKLLSMLEYSIQAQAPAVPMGHGGLV